jgi:hypothetical protein
MKNVEGLRAIGGMIAFVLICVAVLVWYLAGAPLPGRYQIVSSSTDSLCWIQFPARFVSLVIASAVLHIASSNAR